LKISLDLLAGHSGFQLDPVLAKDDLVSTFALRRQMPISLVFHEPQNTGDCGYGSNDCQRLQSIPAHSLIIALRPVKVAELSQSGAYTF
jgi:hypothetical protein